jgi:hypothetical protein
VVALVYGVWLGSVAALGHDPRDFIVIGRSYVERSHRSPAIAVDPSYTYTSHSGHYVGYDGQFCYYLAVDPANSAPYMDDAAYRYTRIGYPMAARLLALGQPRAIPYTLIAVNWLALAGGTAAVAALLRRGGLSCWLALGYGFYPGLFASLQRDLTEPLAYGLVALALYLLAANGRRVLWAGIAFALAVLTRESCAIFAAVTALGMALERPRRWREGAVLCCMALLPFVAYKAFLVVWLGGAGKLSTFAGPLPLQGLTALWPWQTAQVIELAGVVVPCLLFAWPVVHGVARRPREVSYWAYLANAYPFVVMLAASSYLEYNAVGRIASGVVLAALCCLPVLVRTSRWPHWQPLIATAFLLWLAPWLLLLPIPWQGIPHLA